MHGKTISVIVLALLVTLAGSAQESDAPSESSRGSGAVFHGPPGCNYPGSYCVWGQLLNATGPNRERPKPMRKGPIDVCAQWDFNCSGPDQTVCKLHGPHGFDPAEGSYFFVLPVNQGWRIKPRVADPHLSWEPPDATFAAGSVPAGTLKIRGFALLGTAASTSLCSE